MTTTTTLRRATAAAVGLALAATTIGAAAASAAPARTANASVDTTYLSDTLGLPSDTIVETVTYDRFQWLLRQQGQFAFVVGSATDANFKANVVAADAAARAAGAAKLYWFDPNLTGQTGIKNLDTRNPAGINLSASSQTIYGNVWQNVLGQYLGNGIKSVPAPAGTSVTVTADDTIVNDAVNPVWDYRGTETPAVSATDDVFFVYDKDHVSGTDRDTIIDWTNLSTAADATAAGSAVTSVLATAGGGAVIDQLSQFAWWKDSANTKHDLAYADDARYGGDILTDADDVDGFRVKQITYPELLHLLQIKDATDANFVLLFGGTWCHNTRAVLKSVNQQAQDNGVQVVYNFDLVLDGGTTNFTNGSSNPIHVRDNANSGSTTNFRPSWVYGDVVRTYFKNLVTEYDPNTGTRVLYYPGGDVTAVPDVVRKLQVPFLIGYQRGTANNVPSTTVKRQWIQVNTDATTGLPAFKEYMSEWWYTSPSAQIGLNFAIPEDEATLSTQQQTQLKQARAQVSFGQEAVEKIGDFFKGLPGAVASTQVVTAPSVTYGTASTVNLTIEGLYGRVPTGTATLSVGGADYPVTVAANAAVFTTAVLPGGSHPYTITYADDAQIKGFTASGTLDVTKATVKPAGAVSTSPTPQKAGAYKVTVSTPSGLAKATGTVTLTLRKGSTTKTVSRSLTAGAASVALPKLPAGTWAVTVAYSGDANYAATSVTGKSVVSAKAKVKAVAGAVSKKPTTRASGKYTVIVTKPTGLATATGKVTVTLKKGTSTKKVTGTLKGGKVTITVPKLARGTWKATVSYGGDSNYLAKAVTGKSVVVTK